MRKMRKKKFSLGEVLAVIHTTLLIPTGWGKVDQILNWMTGDQLMYHQYPRALQACRPYLTRQFPRLNTPRVNIEITKLQMDISVISEAGARARLVEIFISRLVARYGKEFAVQPIPKGKYTPVDPIDELKNMMGKTRVIA